MGAGRAWGWVIGEPVTRDVPRARRFYPERTERSSVMRKSLVFILTAALVALIASPAMAAGGFSSKTMNRFGYSNVDAFWYTTEWLSDTTYRESVWYIGVFNGKNEIFSDVYRDVELCTVGIDYDQCTEESNMYGSKDLTGSEFTIDSKNLSTAHVDAVYPMLAYDDQGNQVGAPFDLHVITNWTASGALQRSHGTSTYKSGCYSFHETDKGGFRPATATGSIDGTDLGVTDDATLQSNTSVSIEFTC
jgi:hypothetical protein